MRAVALSMKKAASDCGYEMEYLSAVENKDERFAGTDADDKVYDNVKYLHCKRGAKMGDGGTV